MTRKEYIQQEVESVINGKLLPAIKEKYESNNKEAIVPLVNGIAFLYSVGRLEPLQVLCYLISIYVKGEVSDEIKKLFEEREEE